MQQDESCTVYLICMQHMQSAWPHTCTAWVVCNLQCLNLDGIFAACAGLAALGACPVVLAHDIVKALVKLAVLEVMLGYEAHAAGSINEVVEADHVSSSGGACGPVLVCSSNGAAGGIVVCKSREVSLLSLKTAPDVAEWHVLGR